MTRTEQRIHVGKTSGEVSSILLRPDDAHLLYVLAHGAGAGMTHVFMEDIATRLARLGIATLRYNFPYIEQGRRRPDYHRVLHATVRAALAASAELAPDLPMVAGGKSMGGRMTSGYLAQIGSSAPEPARSPTPRGLVFLGFPLHPPKKVGTERAEHLADVDLPMLFLQGTRDKLAQLDLLTPICDRHGATLTIVDHADHGFKVLKRSGRTDEEVMDQLAREIDTWTRPLLG